MPHPVTLSFRRRPPAWAAFARAMVPSPGLGKVPRIPPLAARRAAHPAGDWQRGRFHALTGLPPGEHLPLLYLHALSFPLQFALLTHPAFPVPIWGVLQVRNHLLLHAAVRPGDPIAHEVRVLAQRTGERSTEVDLHSRITREGEPVFEGLNTFWMRQRAGDTEPPSPLARAPDAEGDPVARWHAAADGGLGFARVTGDYNGVHWADWYARRLGFRGTFQHPQRVLAQCAAHLAGGGHPGPAEPQRLDAWIKGPVYCGAPVALRAHGAEGTFALTVGDDPRPAVQGRVRPPGPDTALLDADGRPVAPWADRRP